MHTYVTSHAANTIACGVKFFSNSLNLIHANNSDHKVSVRERQPSRQCGQNPCVPFLRAVLATKIEALKQWWPTVKWWPTALVSPPPRWVSAPKLYAWVTALANMTVYSEFFPYQECNDCYCPSVLVGWFVSLVNLL